MSTANSNTEVTPKEAPNSEELIKVAFHNVMEGVHKRVFFSKLASRGYQPENEEQVQRMMNTAATLMLATKTAETAPAQADPFAVAEQALHNVLQDSPVSGAIKSANETNRTDAAMAAAWELAQNPTIYNSALLLKTAQEELLAAGQ